ncbi:hypothetical protein [Uliginosibacterium sediminicola]|uniref:Uncharacterized protein n=1 Tax=Uliginosibacterium sediminicola TaxID=2024550 RepID=A0ABU9YW10_9RHOO
MTGTKNPKQDDAEALHRKARLRELLDTCFGGKQAALSQHIEYATGKKPNQGELSQILKDHSGRTFGDDKARALTEAIGLHRRWFEMPLGRNVRKQDWQKDLSGYPAPSVRALDARRGPSADIVLQSIAAIAAVAGIPLGSILPDVEAARARISIALGEFAEESKSAPRKSPPVVRVDLSAPVADAKPITKASSRRPTKAAEAKRK